MSCYLPAATLRREDGYTILEMMFAVALLMTVSASVFTGIRRLTDVGETVNNRSSMHAGTRNATELLQQEVGQAGRVTLPAASLTGAVVGDPDLVQTIGVSATTSMFVGEQIYILGGAGCGTVNCGEETVQITAILAGPPRISGKFLADHAVGAAIGVRGAFGAGIVPPSTPNGSTNTVLKLFGDINDDGNMVYVEYTCDTNAGVLYRNQMPFDQPPPKLPPAVDQILLGNIQPNPNMAGCFTYETRTVTNTTFVTDVAITLTVQTPKRDPVTRLFQTETKALLNVSPRNVFEVWQMASMNMTNRVQQTPASVTALLP